MPKWKDSEWVGWLEKNGLNDGHPLPIGQLVKATRKLMFGDVVVEKGAIGEIIEPGDEPMQYLVNWNLPNKARCRALSIINEAAPMISHAKPYDPPKKAGGGPVPMAMFPEEL